jgi:type IV pilus assembly protein PilA
MIKNISILKKNKKGITLIELILYLAMVTMIAPLILQIFVFGYNSYKTGFNYIEQQRKINDAVQHIQRDIELAATVRVNGGVLELDFNYPSVTSKRWSFSGGALKLDGRTIVDGIDVSNSSFLLSGEIVTLKIKTDQTNETINKNRNVAEQIITEFSVKYKQ